MSKKNDMSEYVFIRAWSAYVGTPAWYAREMIQEAKADGAPETATFRDYSAGPGKWSTLERITNLPAIRWMRGWVEESGVEIPKHVVETWEGVEQRSRITSAIQDAVTEQLSATAERNPEATMGEFVADVIERLNSDLLSRKD